MFQLALLFLGSTILGELLRPKPKFNTPTPSALGDFQLPTAEYGRAVPVAYGEVWVKAPNVTWFGDLKVTPITERVRTGLFSKKRVTKGYKYNLGAQLVWCTGMSEWELGHGSGLVEYRFDGKRTTKKLNPADGAAIYTDTQVGTLASGLVTTYIKDLNLFGGDEKEGGFEGSINFHPGQVAQGVNDYLQTAFGSLDIPAFRGYCYSVLRAPYVGNSNYIKPVSAVLRRYPWFWDEAVPAWNIGGDANPVAMVADLLTNADYGLGVGQSALGSSFKLAALKCYEEGIGLSMLFDRQTPARDFIDDILRHVDGVVYTDPQTQKLEVSLARPDYVLADLPLLDVDNISTLTMTRSSWSDTKNVVKIQYTNREKEYQSAVVTIRNQSNIDMREGLKDEETYSFLGVSNATTANKIASRVLRTVSHPLARFQIKANRAAHHLRPGSVFKLDWAPLGVMDMACRVTKISYGDLTTPDVYLDAVEDIFGFLTETFQAPPPVYVEPSTALQALTKVQSIGTPYWFCGEQQHMTALVKQPAGTAVGYKLYRETGTGTNVYEYVDDTVFTPHGTLVNALLTGSVNPATTSIKLSGLTGFSELAAASSAAVNMGANLMVIVNPTKTNFDFMAWERVTANADGTHTFSGIHREMLSRAGRADWPAGSDVWFIGDGSGSSAVPTANARLLAVPFSPTQSAETASGTVLAASGVSNSRHSYLPYAPRKLAAALVSGNLNVTWAHNPKKKQTADERTISWNDTSQPVYQSNDDSVFYIIEFIRSNGTVARTVEVAGNLSSYSYTAEQRTADGTTTTAGMTVRIAARDLVQTFGTALQSPLVSLVLT